MLICFRGEILRNCLAHTQMGVNAMNSNRYIGLLQQHDVSKRIFITFSDKDIEKEFRIQIASAVGGRRGEGAYRKPLLRISRYSASEMDIFTEMDIFRKYSHV